MGNPVTTAPDRALQTRYTTVDGLAIRYATSSARPDQALLLSPWPESLYAFEPMWPQLADHAQLVAVDLPGFGQSEGRPDLLSPRAMGEFVVRIADHLQLDRLHAVGPDVGTSALLFAASTHPDRFRSLVVGSGATTYPLELGEPLTRWVHTPDLARYEAMDPRRIVAGALDGISSAYQLPEHVREDYLSAYDGERFVASMAYVRSYPTELAALGPVLPRVTTPVQVIAGARDGAVPPTNGRYLHDRLPASRLDVIDAGHFTWEDAPDTYARLVANWWART
ncbi:pimeloyl-ACP methyl ester carboxylesterase [Geodermatophilus tzadiensis]|uniref:Pimeloyl-ACP methyl ester carboxylesterase n=1 Tax=Geodermatophilus tzadiensis TaxID=1137988 RepID=A0A2T0TTP5_9ACTN|nr:alpha/beta hydrolase [Geodermatophilus tzadiensis]PRY49035.1 pimeloyl-ACP methyl ester carboxylesterase [Geodermatophilus tzadiensis]